METGMEGGREVRPAPWQSTVPEEQTHRGGHWQGRTNYGLYAVSRKTYKIDLSVKCLKGLTIMDSELHDQTYFVLSTTGIRTMLERGCPCHK